MLVLVAITMVMAVLVMMCVIMGVMVLVPMVAVTVGMPMVVMVPMAMTIMVVTAIMFMGAALGLKAPCDGRDGAALAAGHFGEDVVLLDIERLRGHLGRRMPAAEKIGGLQEAQRVLGAEFQEPLRRGLHPDEAAIFELHRVAVVEHGRLVEVEQKREPLVARERATVAIAALMVEGDGVGDLVGLHGGLADDGSGAKHDLSSEQEGELRHG